MTNKDPTSTSDSYCLQISTSSSLSCESDLSSFSFDKEIDSCTKRIDSDELPAFEIRLLSPLGRSPSPIDGDMDFLSSPTKSCITPTRISNKKPETNYKDNEDFVTLHDINSQISPPSETEGNQQPEIAGHSLETIFEGVFLSTPPSKQRQTRRSNISNHKRNLVEKIAISRLNFNADGKENVQVSTDRKAESFKAKD